jgi:hypothetical protein
VLQCIRADREPFFRHKEQSNVLFLVNKIGYFLLPQILMELTTQCDNHDVLVEVRMSMFTVQRCSHSVLCVNM